jgi:ubiquinone biosynthesis protein
VELGPTFIKFGQLLSDRKDLMPPEVLRELALLQDSVPPFPTDQVKHLIEKNLNESVDSLFIYFNDEPEAAASLAQVHRALLPTGKPVAVKVKRPGIDEQILADIQIMRQLATFVDNNTSYFNVVTASEIVDEFERQMVKELDFVEEFLSIRKFQEDYRDSKTIRVPETYDEYVTRDLLVMEFIHGRKVSEVIEDQDDRYDKPLLNRRTADFIMEQLFINGVFHADPHPGNFLVIEGDIICFIDFGMVYSLRPYELEHLNYMMVGLSRLDPVLVGRSLLRMGRAEGKVQEEAFQSAVHDYIEQHLDKPLAYIDISRGLIDLLQMVVTFGVHLPTRLVYVAKVLGSLQTIGAGLDPNFKLLDYLKDFAPRIWANQIGSRRAGNKFLVSGLDWGDAILEAPSLVRDLDRFLRNPRIKLSAPQLDVLRETYDKTSFRTVFGMVLSALLISSSLVVLADIEPKIQGVPVFGIVGFGVGALMGLVFLFSGLVKLFRWQHKRS